MKFLLVLAIAVAGVACDYTPGITAPFGAFYDIPSTEKEAKSQGWEATESVTRDLKGLKPYCFNDYVICILYDDAGFAAAMQVALPKNNITGSTFSWEVQGFSTWTTPNGVESWATKMYFVDQEYLNTAAATRISTRDSSKLIQGDYFWVTGFNKQLMRVPLTASGLTSASWVKQNCYPGMGYHYYYKLSSTDSCKSDVVFPWFPLEYNGVVHGCGLITYGAMAQAEPRDWFERQTRAGVQATVPDAPPCLYDLVDKPGMVTIHSYFIKKPDQIPCP